MAAGIIFTIGQRGLSSVGNALKSFGDAVAKVFIGIAIAVAAAAAATVAFGVSSIRLFATQQNAVFALSSTVKNLGDEVDFTAKEVETMAYAFQNASTTGDEELIPMMNQFIVKGIHSKEQLYDITQAALDMAATTGKSFDRIGKTLVAGINKPFTSGIALLEEWGIEMSAADKAALAAAKSLNDMDAGRAIMLGLIKGTKGLEGQAKALSKTYSGSVKQAEMAYGDMKEQIGGMLVQSFGLTEKFKRFKDLIVSFSQSKAFQKWMSDAVEYMKPFSDALEKMLSPDAEIRAEGLKELTAALKQAFADIKGAILTEENIKAVKDLGKNIGEGLEDWWDPDGQNLAIQIGIGIWKGLNTVAMVGAKTIGKSIAKAFIENMVPGFSILNAVTNSQGGANSIQNTDETMVASISPGEKAIVDAVNGLPPKITAQV